MTSEATASSGGGVTPDTNTLTKVLKGFADLGVEVAYTELDVRFTVPVTEAKLKVQADAYARVVQSCINVKKCVGITIWVSSLFFFAKWVFGKGRKADLFLRDRVFLTSILGSRGYSRRKVRRCFGMSSLTRNRLIILFSRLSRHGARLDRASLTGRIYEMWLEKY